MEWLVILLIIVAIDVVAVLRGVDSRPGASEAPRRNI